jgi:bifunctional enzyme CysN/CysC
MEHLYITLLGHKDHGKSTLIGRLLHDTKSVPEDRVEEVREASQALGRPFEYAFLLDSFEEERADGMTIDVIHAQVKGRRYLYDCIDVPGHKELIKNMLTGASHADAGILIVSAKEGIEEQTGHHLRLAQWLGLHQLIVAINKMDAAGYDQRHFDAMVRSVRALAGNTPLLERTHFIPISAYEGDNVVQRSARMAWYNGPTLFECMEQLRQRQALSDLPLRMPVQNIYPGPNGHHMIAGRIESGAVSVGQEVVFIPCGERAIIKEILALDQMVATAQAGDNVGLRLDRNLPQVSRGQVCCPVNSAAPLAQQVAAHAIFLDDVPPTVVIECGPAQTKGRVACVVPAAIGEVSTVRVELDTPMVVERSNSPMGRLAIKHNGRVIGVAVAV